MVAARADTQESAPKSNGEGAPFATSLRAEYDPFLLDRSQRETHARHVEEALRSAGIWPREPRILDVGCGSGLLLSALGSDARRRVGCDVRRSLFAQVQPPGVTFAQGAAGDLPFKEDSFDLVICLAVIGEIPEWRTALDDMARCVAPGGVLYVTVANSRFLLPLYRVAGWLGRARPASYVAYARACARVQGRPENGFETKRLRTWRHIDVTAHLARGRLPTAFPLWLLRPFATRFAPSFGFAWQRPQVREHEHVP